MRWRQASTSAHPEPAFLRDRRGGFRTKGLRAGGPGRPDTGSSDRGPARQRAMSSDKRAATGSEGTSVPEGSGRTGFRPGSCEPGMDPELRLMAMSGGTKASAEDPAQREFTGFGPGKRQGREEGREFRIRRAANRQGFGPVGEPPGKPEEASALNGLRRMRGQDLSWLARLETAHCERPASAEPDAKGQWGPAAMPGPITVWGVWQGRLHAAIEAPGAIRRNWP